MLYWPTLMLEEFHVMEIDGDIHTIEGRAGDDTFEIVKEGNSEPERVHLDWITEQVAQADEVTFKKR